MATRHLIDFRQVSRAVDEDQRWDDRVAWDGNLLGAFEDIYPRLTKAQPVPFRLEGGVRVAEGPAHVVLREALVNLLVHADYAESQASLIVQSLDGYLLRNPGSSRISEADLLTGDRSDPRNPVLVRMFRLIGLAEEAGSGMPKIVRAWRELGFVLPEIDVGTERYEFSLSLRHAHLLSDDDRTWLHSLGEIWEEAEQLALVNARHQGEIDNLMLRRLTGQHSSDVTKILVGLRDRGLLEMFGSGRAARYQLGPSARLALDQQLSRVTLPDGAVLQDPPVNLVDNGSNLQGSGQNLADKQLSVQDSWDQAWQLASVSRDHPRLESRDFADLVIKLCTIRNLSVSELAELLGRTAPHIREVVRSLVATGRLAHTFPQSPSHPRQRYAAVQARLGG